MTYKGKTSDLGYGPMGSGLTVWDRTRDNQHNDYLRVAHINPYRKITYYDNAPISEEQRKFIEHLAATDDSAISTTQDTKVFVVTPQPPETT